MWIHRTLILVVLTAAGFGASSAFADQLDPCSITDINAGVPYAGSGCLLDDASEQSFLFTLSAFDTIDLYTTSWANGGFAPVLTLFDASGTEITSDQGGNPGLGTCGPRGLGNTDTAGGTCLDAFIQAPLEAGNYRLVLTESGTPGNVATGNFAGAGPNDQSPNYSYYGASDFTGQQWYDGGIVNPTMPDPDNPGQFIANPNYVDAGQTFLSPNNSFPLSGAWSVSIESSTPEPVSALMGLSGLVAIGFGVRRRRRAGSTRL